MLYGELPKCHNCGASLEVELRSAWETILRMDADLKAIRQALDLIERPWPPQSCKGM